MHHRHRRRSRGHPRQVRLPGAAAGHLCRPDAGHRPHRGRRRPGPPRSARLRREAGVEVLRRALAAGVALTVGLLPATGWADGVRDREQWVLDALGAPQAWRTSKGKGVTVAVLDTGVDGSHRDLTGAVNAGPD